MRACRASVPYTRDAVGNGTEALVLLSARVKAGIGRVGTGEEDTVDSASVGADAGSRGEAAASRFNSKSSGTVKSLGKPCTIAHVSTTNHGAETQPYLYMLDKARQLSMPAC